MSEKRYSSGIKVIEVRVRNFRSLKEVNVQLDWLTVLIGENNAGKTSFLDALFAAIGAGRHNASTEDVFLPLSESKVPKEREVTIDILIRPTDDNGKIVPAFPAGSYWIGLWGDGISQDDEENDFMAVRAQMKWEPFRGEYILERKFLIDWQNDPKKWEQSRTKDPISFSQINPLALHLLDAKRDIKDELRSRNSFWYKLVSDLDLNDDDINRFEENLNNLNNDIISGSGVLAHVQNHVDEIYKTLGGNKGNVSITPVPRHLRDLSNGMNIDYATNGAQSFPLAQHGMGTRSLAAILIFRAYTTWRQKNIKEEKMHTMLALEEPESHLHPQAQRALFNQIEEISGQRIISTHSPYIVSQAYISQYRYFRKNDDHTVVTQMDISKLDDEDIRKINRMVMNTRGDVLYARALVLFEGETEEQALPIFAEKYWEREPNALGISFIGVGGYGNYLPFLRLSSDFLIPWYIFSDGETTPLSNVEKELAQIGITDYTKAPNVFVIPNNGNFESYLVEEKYGQAISFMFDVFYNTKDYIDKEYIPKMHGQRLNKNTKRDYYSQGGHERALADALSGNKTQYGKPLAEVITGIADENLRFPKLIRSLFDKISIDIGLPKREVKHS